MWKKIISLFLVICLLTTVVGCGGGGVVPDTPPDQEPESEEMIYFKDVNPDSGLLYLAGKEDGEKVMSLGSKDSQGNILEMDGAAFVNEQGEGFVVEIGENGYPTQMADTDGNKLTFENYTASTVDVTVYDFDWNLIAGPFTVDIDSDLLTELTQLKNMTKDSQIVTRDAHDVAKYLKAGSVVLKLAGCAVAAIGTAGTGGIAIPLALYACGSAIISLIQAVCPEAIPITAGESAVLGWGTFTTTSILEGSISPSGLLGFLTGVVSDVVETYATKKDVLELHKQFIQALENQDWNKAWKDCVLRSEAQNMVDDLENSFNDEGWDTGNTTVDISFVDTYVSIVDRPIAYVYSNAVITLAHEGSDDEVISGEGLYTEFKEYLNKNKWGVTKSGILNLLEQGLPSGDSEETIDGDIYNIIAPDNFALDIYYTAKVYVENTGDVAHTFTVRGLDNYGSSAIDFKGEEKSISLNAGQTGYVSFEYLCTGDKEDRGLIFRLYENASNPSLDYIDQNTKVIHCSDTNQPPEISDLSANPSSINISQTTTVTCSASDQDGDPLTYHWTKNAGSFEGNTSGPSVTWRAPSTPGTYRVYCEVSDGEGGEDNE